MSEWSKKTLEEVCTKVTDGTHDTPKPIMEGYPLIKGKDISKGYIDFENCNFISEQDHLEVIKRSKTEYGDTLFANIGNSIGDCVYVSTTKEFSIKNIALFKPDQNVIDSKFLFYTVTNNQFQGEIWNKVSGAAQPFASLQLLRKHTIELPAKLIQKKISKILSNYDDLIENNLKRIKLLEESARLTYEEWFLRFRIDGEKLEIDGETGLPFGWKEKEITSIATINKKSITVRTAPEYIKYIDISSTDTGYHKSPEIMNFKDAPSRARRVVEYGDTIFSTVRPNRKTYSLILENDPMLIVSTGFAVVSPNVTEIFPFVYFTLSSQNFINSAVAVAGGAAYPAINQTDFEKLKIVIPTKDILDKFSKLTSPILKNKSNLLDQNQLLKEARDILLPRLMTGMIDVDELEVAV